MQNLITLSAEVAAAQRDRRPVVALESTIITHGMPFPENLTMARDVEAIIRAAGAVPATIAVLDGRLRVGLEPADLEWLAEARGVAKASVRDLPVLIGRREAGGTTVATTALIAEAAGIAVFVTGGIGGVHRGAAGGGQVWDVSADLPVLARCATTVVCAGAKSVLDIPATLEVLETLGVTVLGYKTDRFPAFYTRDAGHGVDGRADSPAEVAAVVRARRDLQLPGGVLVVNPVPPEFSMDPAEMEARVAEALQAMSQEGVTGKAVTPYLLAKMKAVTAGRSFAANLALIHNNAQVGAEIAAALLR